MNYRDKYRDYVNIHYWFIEKVISIVEGKYCTDFREVNGAFDVYYSERVGGYVYFDRDTKQITRVRDCSIGDLHKILCIMDNGSNGGESDESMDCKR